MKLQGDAKRITVAHERVHYKRQGIKVLWWLWKYKNSKSFRWQEEKAAFTAEFHAAGYDYVKKRRDFYVNAMVNQYWGMCNRATAESFMSDILYELKYGHLRGY
jgi:hypothetical protein